MKALGVICARGGSKGLPGKHLLDLAGKPLIAWTIEAAHKARSLSRVILSSDDPRIMAVAADHGCEVPFRRPAELAGDDSPIEGALLHALAFAGEAYDAVVLLQATSPLRSAGDIDATMALLPNRPAAVTVCRAAKPPQWALAIAPDGTISPAWGWTGFRARQAQDPLYMPNGAVFAARVDWFTKQPGFFGPFTAAYVMPRERSIDIDDATDFAMAEAMIESAATERRERIA